MSGVERVIDSLMRTEQRGWVPTIERLHLKRGMWTVAFHPTDGMYYVIPGHKKRNSLDFWYQHSDKVTADNLSFFGLPPNVHPKEPGDFIWYKDGKPLRPARRFDMRSQ